MFWPSAIHPQPSLSCPCALRWAPYLAWLPAALPHLPMFWPPEALERLAGTAAADKLAGTRSLEDQDAFVEPPAEAWLGWNQGKACLTFLLFHAQSHCQGGGVCLEAVLFAQAVRNLQPASNTIVCERMRWHVGELWYIGKQSPVNT